MHIINNHCIQINKSNKINIPSRQLKSNFDIHNNKKFMFNKISEKDLIKKNVIEFNASDEEEILSS